MDVFYRGEKLCELRKFVVMGGEERARADVFLKMLDNRPGDGETVKRGGAAAHFIEKNKTCGSGMGENGGNFAHFDEKSRAATREIVARTNARENAVGDGKLGLTRGHERAHLRHQDDEGSLTQISGFAAHVRAGDQQELLAAWLEAEIVGDKAFAALAEEFFDDGMA